MTKILFILLLSFFVGTQAYSQLYTYTNFGHEQGLEMSTVKAINQSEDGMLWIGTDGAEIYQFNGSRFTAFEGNAKYLFHHISSIHEEKNTFFITSKYLGFFKLDATTGKLEKIERDLKGEPQHYWENDQFSVFISNCSLEILNKNGNEVKKEFQDCSLKLTQLITFSDHIVILSNKGSYVTDGNAIMSIEKWINKKEVTDNYQFGFYSNEKLTLLDKKGEKWIEIVLDDKGGFYAIRELIRATYLQENDELIEVHFNPLSKKGAAISAQGSIYSIDNNSSMNFIVQNLDEPVQDPLTIFVDRNGSIWVGSGTTSIYKLSLEPFTKLRILNDYERKDIAFHYRTDSGEVIVSYFDSETRIFSLRDQFEKRSYPFTVNSVCKRGKEHWMATNMGLKSMKEGDNGNIRNHSFHNKKITLCHIAWDRLFVNVAGEGLYFAQFKGNDLSEFQSLRKPAHFSGYFYTAEQVNESVVIFGSNEGFYKVSKSSPDSLVWMNFDYKKWGSYSGVSTKDKYGNCWFSLDRAIVRFDRKGNSKTFEAAKLFKSNLLYTLQSDQFGNLFLGTNKGIFKIKINSSGSILDIKQFNSTNGFDGYETNMRSQFSEQGGLYVGTVKGLFKISPELFENFPTPSKPVITSGRTENEGNKQFHFAIYNSVTPNVHFVYRIKDLNPNWFPADSTNGVLLSDLSNGKYILEVKASYDGVIYSEPSTLSFEVTKPIWKTSWFIILIVALILGLNIFLINYNRAFDTSSLLDTKDTVIHLRMTPGILLFGFVAISTAHFSAPLLDQQLTLHIGASLLTSFGFLTLYLLALSSKANGTEKSYYNTLLLIGLLLAQGHFFYELYLSDLHPFHLIGIILVSMIVPYVLRNLKQTIIYSIVLLAISLIYVQIIKDPVYSKVYFLIAIFIQSCLLIFISYLRYNSLEKLLFISAIINKGNLPAIAFDKQGTIQYVSENISLFADTVHDQLLKRNITYLNKFVPFDDKYRETDILKDLIDGENYLVPMKNRSQQIKWIEWSFKQFTDELRVIIGQDVTERMDLENTYELLVQNAEDFIYRCDVGGNFTFLNNVCFEKLGFSKEELLGSSSLEIVDEEYRDGISAYYADHFSQRKTSSYREFPIRTKEGALLWIGQYVTTLFVPGSKDFIKGFIALARDITDIRTQQALIIEQRDNITSSIHYARRIQQNLLPHERMFSNLFQDHFILYKAKDIVSGDFYWMDDTGDQLIFALADCTGHGIPGSFMTVLGMNLLNMIVLDDKIFEPGKILDQLDERLLEILPRGEDSTQVNDGMEITVCALNKNTGVLSYACAGSRFLIYRKDEFTMFKGDNKHIGDVHFDGFVSYQTNYTQFNTEDELIMFTDGFQDQFGGPNDKKYSFRRLLEVFEEVITLDLGEQKRHLENEFDTWIGQGEQTDDLTIIALKRKH